MFETPKANDNHWDVMGGDIITSVALEAQGEEAQSEDYDEIEYMPPTAKGARAAFHRVTHNTNAQCRYTIRTAL